MIKNILLFRSLKRIYKEISSKLPDDQYYCVKSLNCYNFLFQASNENNDIGTNLIGEADIEEESEELKRDLFCDDQAICSGTKWNIICLSTVSMLKY